MRFTPKSEKELKRDQLLQPGIYPFTVLTAADKVSKDKKREDGSPKEMIALKLNVHGDDRDYHVYDYISGDFMPHKLRHFAVSVGLEKSYESGTLTAGQCDQRQGWCRIDVQDSKAYGPQNKVDDYCMSQSGETVEAEAPGPDSETLKTPNPDPVGPEDDVPF